MDSSLSPREIQARIRSGATVEDVAREAGVEAEQIQGFALPVVAEREHMAASAQRASVRRRGNGTGHRRLGEIVGDRLQARGINPEDLTWDAWRQPDLLWRVRATLDQPAARSAEFVFDPRGRFCTADNADARWMIGEQVPGSPDTENTVDLDDELAIVRAVQEPSLPGDELPPSTTTYADAPELDEFYDMLSGISEDSVRIYVGLDEESAPEEPEFTEEDAADVEVTLTRVELTQESVTVSPERAAPVAPEVATPAEPAPAEEEPEETPAPADEAEAEPVITEPEQDALIGEDTARQPMARKPGRRRRASIPSWDEIMFGGPTK